MFFLFFRLKCTLALFLEIDIQENLVTTLNSILYLEIITSRQEGGNYFSLYGIYKLQVMNRLFLELGGWCTKILCFGMKDAVEIALSTLKNYANLVDV